MSELHDALADALVEVLDGLDVRAYKWSQGGIKVPCAVIELPTFRRTEPDQPESRVGADDWRLDFPVIFYREITSKAKPQAELASTVERFIKAIDNLKPSSAGLILNDLCEDAKVVEADPFLVDSDKAQSRDLVGYETHVSLLAFQ